MMHAIEIAVRRFLAIALIATGFTVAPSAWSGKPVGHTLTSKLRSLLQQEMQHVLQAQQQILTALIMGDHGTVAEKAQQIHDSFILEQSLTPQDLEDLEKAVPEEFVALDRAFHGLAENLVQAAKANDAQQEARYFNEMTSACVGCHSRFVTDRFPGFEY